MESVVLSEVRDRVAVVTLNRPEAFNAMSPELLDELLDALEHLTDDRSVRALVLTGSGRAFCVGGDLNDVGVESSPHLGTSTASTVRALRTRMRAVQLLHEAGILTIAAINGGCAGAGLGLALACDLRLTVPTARFSTGFLTAGLSGDFGVSWFLPRVVGGAAARELMLLAEKFDADRALRLGLVHEVVAPDQLLQVARERAVRAASLSPAAFSAGKDRLNDADGISLSTALDREADSHVRVGEGPEAREAALAFLQGRPADFEVVS